jgi:putative transposase
MNKAIRYRIYPTTEQATLFAKTFGCCRKVYNLMLSDKIESYKATGKFATVTPARYKKDYPYLKEVDSLALANKQMDLQAAFRNCFNDHIIMPKNDKKKVPTIDFTLR